MWDRLMAVWPERLRTRARVSSVAATAGVALVAVVALVAHGGGTTPASAQRSGGSRAGDGTPSAVPSADATAGSLATPSAAATAAPTAAAPGAHHTPASGGAWFTVTLGASCVMPGGTQHLSVLSRPGYTVAFNSRYPDGKTGDTYGGFGLLPTDSAGRASTSWTVSAAAPPGTVTVSVGTGNGGTPTTATRTFVVAAHC